MKVEFDLRRYRIDRTVTLTRQGWFAPEIARELGVSTRSVERYRVAAGVQLGHKWPEHRLKHGEKGYQRGCRCDECVTTWKEAQVRYRKARIERGLPPGDPRHGTANGYVNWSCKCLPCREAGSARNRNYLETSTK